MADIANTPVICEKMMELFSHGRYAVFRAAAEYASAAGMGLLEASEVIEPDPSGSQRLNFLEQSSQLRSRGTILYHEAALEQIRAIQGQEKHKEGTPEKPGFFSRLFGKK
jgi:hypothetical protein